MPMSGRAIARPSKHVVHSPARIEVAWLQWGWLLPRLTCLLPAGASADSQLMVKSPPLTAGFTMGMGFPSESSIDRLDTDQVPDPAFTGS